MILNTNTSALLAGCLHFLTHWIAEDWPWTNSSVWWSFHHCLPSCPGALTGLMGHLVRPVLRCLMLAWVRYAATTHVHRRCYCDHWAVSVAGSRLVFRYSIYDLPLFCFHFLVFPQGLLLIQRLWGSSSITRQVSKKNSIAFTI